MFSRATTPGTPLQIKIKASSMGRLVGLNFFLSLHSETLKQTRMKKIFSLLLILAVAVSFAACGDDDNDPKEKPQKPHPELGNDPDFNPIVGDWWKENRPFGESLRIDFSSGFTCKRYTQQNEGDEWVLELESPYLISDTQIKLTKTDELIDYSYYPNQKPTVELSLRYEGKERYTTYIPYRDKDK